jgi:hypothetical protein
MPNRHMAGRRARAGEILSGETTSESAFRCPCARFGYYWRVVIWRPYDTQGTLCDDTVAVARRVFT